MIRRLLVTFLPLARLFLTMPHARPVACLAAIAALFLVSAARAADFPILDLARLELQNARTELLSYRGHQALKITEKESGPGQAVAILKDLAFHDGTIELDLAGAPSKTAPASARGFVGILFRVQPGGGSYESIYLRPSNGRAENQEQRNHSTQYVSAPDWPWERLRKETPGRYESYVDLEPGVWTHMRVVVRGTEAQLFVGDATQPCLLVHNLKLGDASGGVALWAGPGTEAYFRDVRVTPR